MWDVRRADRCVLRVRDADAVPPPGKRARVCTDRCVLRVRDDRGGARRLRGAPRRRVQ